MLKNFKNEQNKTSKNINSFPFKTNTDSKITFLDKNIQKEKTEKAENLYASIHFRNIFLNSGLIMLLGNGLLHLIKSPVFDNSIIQKILSLALIYNGLVLTSFALLYLTPMIALDKKCFHLCYRSPYEKMETPKQLIKN